MTKNARNHRSNLVDVLSRLKRFQAMHNRQRQNEIGQCLRRIEMELPKYRREAREHEARFSPRFNVYRVLRLERKEVLLHSRMLAHLLDPYGTHGQGFLFLTGFLRLLDQLEEQRIHIPIRSFTSHNWFVETEKATGNCGIIDLLLSCPDLGYRLAIENKIDADEQKNQVSRYCEWLDKGKIQFHNYNLIFLTPDGRESSTAKNAVYTCLSYRHDIRRWLINALDDLKAPTVKAPLEQYLRIIQEL